MWRAALIMAVLFHGAPVMAQTALRDEPSVRDGIIFVGMAIEIAENCPTISARVLRGAGYLHELRQRARDLGYSGAQIDAYINDSAEKARLEAIARAQLATLGVRADAPESYCAAGQAQMAAKTRVGWLLR